MKHTHTLTHTRFLDIHSELKKDDITHGWDSFYYDGHIAVYWKTRSVASEEGNNNDKMDRMWKEATVEYFKVPENYTYLHKLCAQV